MSEVNARKSRSAPPPEIAKARRYSVMVAAVASISGLMFGWDSMALNVVKKALVYHTGAGNGMLGFAIAFGVLTAALGAFIAGRLSDRIGRRAIMLTAAVLFIISSIGTVFIGDSMGMFLFWRFFSGLAMGSAMTIAPAYISEVAPADLRGTLVSLRQFMLIIGLFICGLLGDHLLAIAPTPEGDAPQSTAMLSLLGFNLEVWQWAFLSVCIGGIVYLVTTLLVPESPRYLIAKGRDEEARAVLVKTVGDVDGSVDVRIEEIRKSLSGNGDRRGFRVLLDKSGRRLQKIVWIGVGLAALQQLVGINAIFYYSTTIFSTLGFGEQAALQQTLILTGVKVLAIIMGMILIDRIGRRPLLIFGSASMLIALIATAVIMLSAPKVTGADGSTTPDLASHPALAIIALIALCLYVFSYAGTWGPIMWVLIGEMFPNRIRGAAVSVSGGVEWASNFLVTLTFPVLAAWSIGTTYAIYACVAAFSLIFVIKLVPETKNLELEEMDNFSD
ncbi:sugar porter family MFS transporter [Bifidobacterium simiarum]|uniref:sugar porter family MFS transporter n=1 Tax=Bifidobacterium simiarum TaxID=2045441 RepID=UPI001BDD535D|nr:sugar porter family MFS transporter [Bifidobacterium simiarum]MBT1166018.1 sugar porter family MFS transporter [Bifidobacterium simiarum]